MVQRHGVGHAGQSRHGPSPRSSFCASHAACMYNCIELARLGDLHFYKFLVQRSLQYIAVTSKPKCLPVDIACLQSYLDMILLGTGNKHLAPCGASGPHPTS